MATVLDVINGISQALSNTHDGAVDSEGNKVNVGLRRDQETAITDRRVMDGFGARVSGNKLLITYHR